MPEKHRPKITAKDCVFTHLFRDKKYTLQLYQALHPEDTQVTEDRIELVTLENVLMNELYNDLGFMVEDRLIILVEAQSTWSVNIIIRTLFYLARTYQSYLEEREVNLYGTKPVPLPKPELYVIYTGERKIQQKEMSLSEVFFGGTPCDLDVRVHVITDGRTGDIIQQYVGFTKVLTERMKESKEKQTDRVEAVREALEICKDRNYLKEFLTKHESEVLDMVVSLYDEEHALDMYERELVREATATARAEGIAEGETRGRSAGLAEGRSAGLAEGLAKGQSTIAKNMLREGLPVDTITRITGLSSDDVSALAAGRAMPAD